LFYKQQCPKKIKWGRRRWKPKMRTIRGEQEVNMFSGHPEL